MHELWQKRPDMLWQRPALWVPMMAAAVLHFILSTLSEMATRHLHLWMPKLRHGSVLDATTAPHMTVWLLAFAVLVLLISIANLYTSYLRVPAFFATAQMAGVMERHPEASLRDALHHVRVDQRQTFWFAAQILAAEIVMGLILLAPIAFYRIHHHLKTPAPQAPYVISGFLFQLALAYWMTPSAITLLRPLDTPQVEPERLRRARSFAMLCAGSAYGISFLFRVLFNRVATNRLVFHGVGLLSALVETVPYVALAIVLGQVARSDRNESQDISPGTYNL